MNQQDLVIVFFFAQIPWIVFAISHLIYHKKVDLKWGLPISEKKVMK